ncbi:LysR substrate-binding domain-containing protein [Pseudogemmobacter humi]|uniref:Glycine cleavage system transcriptional activator n=1 Tax=Pseudogemmobacter humi TaxID=2483812 RepID=A0A3P5WUS1_9RHOB|nr:LysR substrate-binding domain-containing protein [Pseudogemmobacter humi]VDC22940.1 Glycine cleavage system transcriptional activator [Pseudogemmobacter humi]
MAAPLNALRAFEAAARLGSFKAAADALFVTQSAISHQIRHVEDWLGKPLFAREGNRTRLLDEGAELARSLSIALAEIEAACRRARAAPAAQTLVIAAIPSIAMCWLIPRLSRFRAAHPEIEFRVVYAMHGRDIDFDVVHMAFVFATEAPRIPGVSGTYFLGGESVPVCAPSLAQRLGSGPWTAAQIMALGLLHDDETAGWQIWLNEMGEDVADAIHGATFEDFNLLRAAALSGQGVALCPLAMMEADLRSGSLVQLSGHIIGYGWDYYLLSTLTAGPVLAGHAQVFRDWALAERGRSCP